MQVYNRVREYRICRGLSQSDLSKLCGLSQNSISNIENDVFSPTLQNAYMLAIALDCDVYDIFPAVNLRKVNVDRFKSFVI